MNTNFIRGCVPHLPLLNDKGLAKIIQENIPRIKNLRPDMTFGYKQAAFTPEEYATIAGYEDGVVRIRTMYYPLLSLDVKSLDSSLGIAEL